MTGHVLLFQAARQDFFKSLSHPPTTCAAPQAAQNRKGDSPARQLPERPGASSPASPTNQRTAALIAAYQPPAPAVASSNQLPAAAVQTDAVCACGRECEPPARPGGAVRRALAERTEAMERSVSCEEQTGRRRRQRERGRSGEQNQGAGSNNCVLELPFLYATTL